MNNQNHKCHLCHSDKVFLFSEYPHFYRVTSDCKPWKNEGSLALCLECNSLQKIVNSHYTNELEEIYQQYDLYFQGRGKEQPIFENNSSRIKPIAVPRSQHIINLLQADNMLPEFGKILDFGCGKGDFLYNFAQQYNMVISNAAEKSATKWKLYAYEQNDKNEKKVKNIVNLNKFYSGDINTIDEKFNLISLLHSLEHIINPQQLLTSLREKLYEDSLLLIQVPSFKENPFDLLVADHCNHFTIDTLSKLLFKSGYHIEYCKLTANNKEITLLAKKNSVTITQPHFIEKMKSKSEKLIIQQQLNWLLQVQQQFLL